jgi:hypothetical protein
MQAWVRVSAAMAEQHPLFGLHGWLRVVSLLMTLTVIVSPLVTVVFAVQVLDLPPWHRPGGMVMVALLALGTATALVMAVLWFRRAPNFLRAYAELSALSIALDFAGELLLRQWPPLPAPFDQGPGNLLADVLSSVVISALPFWLFWRSRRFRVTFQHELRADDPLLR